MNIDHIFKRGEESTLETGKTIIGQTIEIEGQIQGDEDLVVQGKVNGEIMSQQNLFVDQTGHVEATVNTRNLHISGKVVGNIEASEKVEITKEGKMTGDIKAPKIMIADGAKFKGNIDMAVD
jgi:cytoskeletal protein CcmA (bactofilin family)